MIVVDCSVVIAWVLDEEAGEIAARIVDRLWEDGAVVPAIWTSEIANALLVAERRARSSAEVTSAAVAMIEELPVAIDESPFVLHDVLGLARSAGLSAYDAAYLELAARLDAQMATLDVRLRRVCRERGVTTI